uniref:Apple domain-containing protein n=1 Tax=Plectus sambesii TaxID=2011161 RepID=A0A914UZ70_9BILA
MGLVTLRREPLLHSDRLTSNQDHKERKAVSLCTRRLIDISTLSRTVKKMTRKIKFLLITSNFLLQFFAIDQSLALQMTYSDCMSDSTSRKLGGWCFFVYYNTSWGTNYPTAGLAETFCHPHANLAYGPTFNMLNYYNLTAHAQATAVWTSLARNASYGFDNASRSVSWQWRTLLPNGKYSTYPAILANIPWHAGDPFISPTSYNENNAMIWYNYGAGDCEANISASLSWYSGLKAGVLCQFAPPLWTYSKRGSGRFSNSSLIIEHVTNCPKLLCFSKCHNSVFCVSLAYSPSTKDCQTYGVSPEDPRMSPWAIADPLYEWHIRDGMVY